MAPHVSSGHRLRVSAVAAMMLAGAAVMVPSSPVAAADIVVTTLEDVVDPGDGETSLFEAIELANADPALDRVLFADGLTGTASTATGLLVSNDIEIVGPGRDRITIANSSGQFSGISSIAVSNGADLSISGVTVDGDWGAISARFPDVAGSLSLDESEIRSYFNVRSNSGLTVIDTTFTGTLSFESSSSTAAADVRRSTFSGGLSLDVGGDVTVDAIATVGRGGQFDVGGDLTITNSTFTNDSGVRDDFSAGIRLNERWRSGVAGNDLIDNVTIRGGSSWGILVERHGKPVEIRNSTIDGRRRGIQVTSIDEVTIVDTHVSNSSEFGIKTSEAAVQGVRSEPIVVERSTLSGSRSSAIRHRGSNPISIIDSTLTGNNHADDSPVVYSVGPATITNSTITENGRNGQITPVLYGPGHSADHSIITGNHGKPLFDEPVAITNSLLPFGADEGSNVEADNPKLGQLDEYGGPTPTMLPATDSPAIDAGNPTVTPPTTDQRGEQRIVGDAIDIGAVERQASDPEVAIAPLLDTTEPVRLLDTRPGEHTIDDRYAGTGPVPTNTSIEVQIAGRPGIPTNATAAIINLTATNTTSAGFATAYPCTDDVPLASTLNWTTPNHTIANSTIIPLSPDGTLCIYTLTTTDLIIDATGSLPPNTDLDTTEPVRLLDTRPGEHTIDDRYAGTGPVPTNTSIEVQIAGRPGIPTNATAAIINLTATNTTSAGFATAYPCTDDVPLASTLNWTTPNHTIANSTIIPLSPDGTLCIYTLTTTDLIIDATGSLPPNTDLDTTEPVRLLDTRPGEHTIDDRYAGTGPVPTNTSIEVQIAGRPGIPTNATAAIINLTATNTTSAGFATAYPCTDDVPLASTLNWTTPNHTIANSTIIPLSPDGTLCIYTLTTADLIIDATGSLP